MRIISYLCGQQMRAFALLVAMISCWLAHSIADDTHPKGDASAASRAELEALSARVKTKIGKTRSLERTKETFSHELDSFDALLSRYERLADEEALAMILFKKATLYYQVFKEHDLAISTMSEICNRFPDTERSKAAIEAIKLIKSDARAVAIRERLIPGETFPLFDALTVSGDPIKLDSYKGSVVLVHFWSSECDLCQSETPVFKSLYLRYRDRGFTIIGISVDEDRSKLQSYLSDSRIEWPQAFDGRGWSGDLFTQYGVKSIPETYLIDEEGKIIARNLPLDSLTSFLDQYLAN